MGGERLTCLLETFEEACAVGAAFVARAGSPSPRSMTMLAAAEDAALATFAASARDLVRELGDLARDLMGDLAGALGDELLFDPPRDSPFDPPRGSDRSPRS